MDYKTSQRRRWNNSLSEESTFSEEQMKVVVSCAEYSGDLIGAEILSELRQLGDYEWTGICGPQLRSLGIKDCWNMEHLNSMGFIEVLGNLKNVIKGRNYLQQVLHQADALICIDSSSFHAPLLQLAKSKGIASIGISSPQIWAWRSHRIPKIARSMSALFCLFAFEPAYYPNDFRALWQGHPIVDRFTYRTESEPFLFGLLPGSRSQEIRRHLPIFLRVAKRIKQQHPKASFLCSTPSEIIDLPDYVKWQQVQVKQL